MRRSTAHRKRNTLSKEGKQISPVSAKKASSADQENTSRAKSEFIANISHEIRTPMNAIMGFAQMLKTTPLNEAQTDYVDVILDSGKKLLLIITNLLDLSNLQLGKSTLNLKLCHLQDMFIRLKEHFEPLIIAKNLKPLFQCTTEDCELLLDCEKIERVVSFIISNAIKYTQKGYVSFKLLTKQQKNQGLLLCMEISDSGIGISEDKLPHVFDVFEQGDNSITRPFGGMGIGLGLSKRIVLLLGGSISAISKVGEGSVFTIEIPVMREKPKV
ncbi:MAG: HAMP domain-containing sensor histidine kinase [Candidatus Cloacimonetes bacterium]|nr:HAMP domain-containing sensor histidine kinase [Candidatus Cloacimonadota bacterium]